jgi:hypothetical protein
MIVYSQTNMTFGSRELKLADCTLQLATNVSVGIPLDSSQVVCYVDGP